MPSARSTFLLLLLLAALCGDALAGRLYARRKNTASPLYNLRLTAITTTVTITDLLATTHVDETFRNDAALELEGFYVFQLPAGARVDGLWMWIDGTRQTFTVKRLSAATQQYDSLVQAGIGDPAILQSLGDNRFQLKIFPIRPGSSRRIELRYFETLPMNADGLVRYSYPLALAGYQSTVVDSTHITVAIGGSSALDSLRCNFEGSPHLSVGTPDTAHAQVTLAMTSLVQSEDLILTWKPRAWHDRFHALTWLDPDTTDDGFMLTWLPFRMPTVTRATSDYVFAVDASGSMHGLRRGITLEAIRGFLMTLQKHDRYRLVFFTDVAVSHPPDTAMLFATPENLASTMAVLDGVFRVGGLTNYEVALRAGMQSAFRTEADLRMLLLTDGLPNMGAATADNLAPLLVTGTGRRVRLYPVTLYCENQPMLAELAARTQAMVTRVEQGDDLASAINRTAFDFTPGALDDVALAWPTDVYQTLPRSFPAGIAPERLLAAGRFVDPTSGPVTVSARRPSVPDSARVTRTVAYGPVHAGPKQVARYWASLRIAELTDELRTTTDSTEIIESIIRLSERFMLLTPWTAFIVVNDVIKPPTTAVEAAGTLTRSFELHQNHPNPFNPSTTITFVVPPHASGQHVRVAVYDAQGREVCVLWDAATDAGIHHLVWHGRNAHGKPLASGSYVCVLTSPGVTRTITMLLVK